MPQLKAGTRIQSAVCNTEVMVIAAPAGDVDVRCGGAPMLEISAQKPGGTPDAAFAGGTQIGKRYVNEEGDLELLCTKPGDGSLSVGDKALSLKEAKPLPSSD
jgi:hypothetical protein